MSGKAILSATLETAKAGSGQPMTRDPRRTEIEMSVQYTVKEILSRIEIDIKAIMAMMSMKAERAELESLKTRVDILEKRGSDKAQQAEQKVEQLETIVEGLKERAVERDYVQKLEQDVNALKQDNTVNENIQKNREAWEKSRSDTKWLIVGIVINGLMAVGGLVAAFAALKAH